MPNLSESPDLLRRFMIAVALTSVAILAGHPAMATPERPSDDALVLAIVPPGRSGAAIDLRKAKADLAANPADPRLAAQVARLAIAQGRAASDPRLYGQAEAALAPWWDAPNPPAELRVLRAVILQASHDFQRALVDLDAVLAASPRNAQARLSRAFVRMTVGDLSGAAEDCRAMSSGSGLLPAATCRSRVDALTGAGERGYMSLERAIAFDARADATARRFALSVLANIAAGLGRRDDADRLLADAAAAGAPDVPLLAATADHYLDTGRVGEVLALLDGKGEADPLLLRRAIAARRLGDPRLAEWAAILNERFAAARAAGNQIHLREEARFRLEVEDDAAKALMLAVENWRTQKEPEDARLVLAAARTAKSPAAADDVVRFVRDAGMADARVTPLLQGIEEQRS